MTISINWATKVITVPQADLTFVSAGKYQLDVDAFRLNLKDIEDSVEGQSFPDTHRHSTQTILSGVAYARQFEIINGYTVTFEDGQYTVECVGANHNIGDVKNVNQVSLIIGNSAGLIVAGGGAAPADIATAVWAHATGIDLTAKMTLALKVLRNKMVTDPATGLCTIYDDDNTTVLLQGPIYEDVAGTQPYRGQGADRRNRLT
jgi:hypothetical protein